MSCPKNIVTHKFLWWKWQTEGRHNFILTYVGKFMSCSKHFETERTCSICGTIEKRSFTEMEELIREGIPADTLNKITPNKPLTPQ